jgi:hypothetical protein
MTVEAQGQAHNATVATGPAQPTSQQELTETDNEETTMEGSSHGLDE